MKLAKPTDRKVGEVLDHWLDEAGGELPDVEAEARLRAHFGCVPLLKLDERRFAVNFNHLEADMPYEIEEGTLRRHRH